MKLNIQLTPEDYVKATFIHMRPRPFFKYLGYFMLLLIVIVLPISIYEAAAHQKDIIVPAGIILSLAFLAWNFGITVPKRVRKIFKQQKALHTPYSFAITTESILIKSERGETNLTWDYFLKWKESKDLFLLYSSDVMFHMIPKRCFTSPDEAVQFRSLLLEKIGSTRK
jgi:YcxB-like protein